MIRVARAIVVAALAIFGGTVIAAATPDSAAASDDCYVTWVYDEALHRMVEQTVCPGGGGGGGGGSSGQPGRRVPREWTEVRWEYFRCMGKPDGAQKITEYWREGELEPYRVQRTCNWTYQGDPPPVPDPPAPPTAPDISAFAEASGLLPGLEIHLNPSDGLVAMDTWLWFEHEPTFRLQVPDLNGWTGWIDLQVQYAWQMGDADNTTVRSSTPGSYGDPSATFVYERACYCTVTVSAAWTGTFTVTFNGFLDHTEEIEPIVFTESVDYPVFEAQAINIPG